MDWDKILDEQAKDPGFAPVPASKYPVRVEKAEAIRASTGAEMIKIEAVIVGGPYDTKKLWTNIVFSLDNATAMRFTLRKLAGLGISREYIAQHKPNPAQIAAMLVGVMAEAEVEVKPYQGENKNEIKMFRQTAAPAAGSPPAPPAPPRPGVPNVPAAAAMPATPPAPPAPEPTPPTPDVEETPDVNDEEPF